MKTKTIMPARIKSLRESKGWSQSELAREANVEQSYISRLEAGDAPNASGIVLARIARALQTTTDYLLGLSDDPNPRPPPNHPSLNDPLFRDIMDWWLTRYDDHDRKTIHSILETIAKKREPR